MSLDKYLPKDLINIVDEYVENKKYLRCIDCDNDIIIGIDDKKSMKDHKLPCINGRISYTKKLLQALEKEKLKFLNIE